MELAFYDDRLMSVYFTPEDDERDFRAVSATPGAEALDGGVVALPGGAGARRVGATPNGRVIEWDDRRLRDERTSRIAAHS